MDLFPTILELAGIDLDRALPAGLKIDGVTLLPHLRNVTSPHPRTLLYTERFTMTYDGDWQRAVYERGYRLIERYDGSREFYNVDKSPLEKVDLLKRPLSAFETKRFNSLEKQMNDLILSR